MVLGTSFEVVCVSCLCPILEYLPLYLRGFLYFKSKLNAIGGEGGIRTLGEYYPTSDFESGAIDHSTTSPCRGAKIA